MLLGILSITFAALAPAVTLNWDFTSGTNHDLGTSSTFDSSPGGTTVTVYGFSGADRAAQLFGKHDGGSENGLGLDLDEESDYEITGKSFIQIDISNLASLAAQSDFEFIMGSATGSDRWEVLGSNTLGSAGSTILDGPGKDQLTSEMITPDPAGTYRYLTFKATAGDVLLRAISIDPPVGAPEPASLLLMGAGLLGFGALRGFRRGR